MLLKNLKTTLGAMLLASAASGAYSADLIGYISPIARQPGSRLSTKQLALRPRKRVGSTVCSMPIFLPTARCRMWTLCCLWAQRPSAHGHLMPMRSPVRIREPMRRAFRYRVEFHRRGCHQYRLVGKQSLQERRPLRPGGGLDRQAQARSKGHRVRRPPVESIINNAKMLYRGSQGRWLKVIDRVDNTKDSTANAATLAADEFTKFPDVQVFWAYNDSSALGISAAAISLQARRYSTARTKAALWSSVSTGTLTRSPL